MSYYYGGWRRSRDKIETLAERRTLIPACSLGPAWGGGVGAHGLPGSE